MRDKIRSIVQHPAAGLATVAVINTAIVVVSVIATRKLEKKNLEA
jgi:hypothetical protein